MESQKLTLTLKPVKMNIDKIQCNEKVDINILDKLIKSSLLKNTFNNPMCSTKFKKGEKEQLLKYKALVDDTSFANVIYSRSKGIKYGRVLPAKSLGYHSFRRELRQTLTKNYYTDIDVENCHPVMLLQICKENGIDRKYLKLYVKNREQYLNDCIKEFNINRDDAKKLFIRLLYCGSFEYWLEENNIEYNEDNDLFIFISNFEANIKIISKVIIKNNSDLVKQIEKIKDKVKDATVLSYFLQEYECRVLNCMYNYLVDNNIIVNNDCVLCADGLMIPTYLYNISLLSELENEIFNKTGFLLKLTEKKMTQDYLEILDNNIIIDNNKKDTSDMMICETDIEAAELIYSRIKDKLIYCYKTLYFKKSNIWLNNIKEIECALLDIVMNSNIYKYNDKGDIKPYVQNYTSATKIMKTIIETLAMRNEDDSFYNKFTTSTKGKLCFKNGVLDIPTKKFIKWEDIKQGEEVYTTFYITRNFNEERNEEIIDIVYNNVFKAVYNNDVNKALHFLSRAMGGYVEDKIWGLFIGRRNCGKGVIEHFFKSAFQQYIGTLSSDLFMCERQGSAITDTKKLSWLMELEFARITFTQEATFDDDNKNIKIDGTKIKKICSGGDIHKARKNYQNEREFGIQSTLMFSANNFPAITPKDTLEFVCSFSSTRQFKSKEFIKSRIDDNANEKEIMLYREADPLIKEKCASEEWCNALVHILIDNFKDKSVMQCNLFEDKEEDNTNYIDLLLKDFKITNEKKDFVDNKTIKNWCINNKLSFTQHIRPLLLTDWQCKEGRENNTRGLFGIKYIKDNDSDFDEQL
jgi:hypothetical protein